MNKKQSWLALENNIYGWMGRHGIWLLQISLGILYIWFGAQKFFPGISSAEDLATRTIETLSFGLVGPGLSMPLLATWEVLIGLGFLIGRRVLRYTLILLYAQMIGTFLPLFMFPGETFYMVPLVPTLEGQYILKNLLIIFGAMVVGAALRGKLVKKT